MITPAVAGPFDLGDVVTRMALFVDSESTQVRAVSDPMPSILKGIPLEIRSVLLNLDRGQFVLNPTNCGSAPINGVATAVSGQSVALKQHFQVGECGRLDFKPKLAMSLKGSTKRRGNPALKAVLTTRPGDANVAQTVITMPKSELFDNAHLTLDSVCTKVQFAASQCPASSVFGYAKAVTPLLEKPIEGPIYLRSSSTSLPDLVADLNGQLRVALPARIDTTRGGGIRTTFESVPDVPISQLTFELKGGKKGLLKNSTQPLRPHQQGDGADRRPERQEHQPQPGAHHQLQEGPQGRQRQEALRAQGGQMKRTLYLLVVLAIVAATRPGGRPGGAAGGQSHLGDRRRLQRGRPPRGNRSLGAADDLPVRIHHRRLLPRKRVLRRPENPGHGSQHRRRHRCSSTPAASNPRPPTATARSPPTAAARSPGAIRRLTTREANPVFSLPDRRGWEMVSPVDKNGGSIQNFGETFGGGVIQAAAQEPTFTYTSASSFADPTGAPGAGQYLSRRGSNAWSTENVTPPAGVAGGYPESPASGVPYQIFSTDLASGLLSNGRRCRTSASSQCPVENPPLAGSEAPAGYRNYYMRDNSSGSMSGAAEER